MKLSKLSLDRKILVSGGSGSGKTHFIGTMAKTLPTLVVTADPEGLETLKSQGVDPEVLLVESWLRAWDYYDAIAGGSERYGALAIDDLGAVQDTTKRKIQSMPRTGAEEKMKRDEREKEIRRELMLGERRMQIQHWGDLSVAIESWLLEVLKLPYRVKVVTVLEEKDRHPRTGEEHIYPAIDAAKFRHTIAARFGIVAEAFVTKLDDRTYFAMSTRSHPRMETKDRTGRPRTWENPSFDKILQHLGGQGEESELERRIGLGI